MKIQKLFLQGFRGYPSKLFDFEDQIVVLLGGNAAGKTNVLEAICLLATGDSFRAKKIEEMVAWDVEVGHVAGKVKKPNDEEVELKIALTRGIVGGERAQKRKYMVNGVARRKSDFVGNIVVTTFLPTDLSLMNGSPSRRRRYLDTLLSQVDREYRRSLLSYEKGLRRRNKVLEAIRERKAEKSGLFFWDSLLIKEGGVLTKTRRELMEFMNMGSKDLRIVYKSSAITESRLEDYAYKEVGAGHTLIGPHKDDFYIESLESGRSRDLSVYGSRGEQRMAVLWLKIRELDFVEKMVGERPVLILDDIFSELDEEHEKEVWEMTKRQQTFVSTTDMQDVKGEAQIIEI